MQRAKTQKMRDGVPQDQTEVPEEAGAQRHTAHAQYPTLPSPFDV